MGTEELSFSRFFERSSCFFPASQRRLRCSSFFSSSEKTTFLRTALKKLRLFILFSLWLSLPHLNFLSPSLLLLRAPLRLIQKLFFSSGEIAGSALIAKEDIDFHFIFSSFLHSVDPHVDWKWRYLFLPLLLCKQVHWERANLSF